MSAIRALYDHVVVSPDSPVEKTASGLFVVDTKSERRPVTGTVMSVGPGARFTKKGERIPLDVKPGDRIHFPKFGVHRMEIEGKDVVILDQDQILAIEEK